MKPLVKWSGGKGREIKLFKQFYPKDFKRYIEPFVGGGAVYFDLEHNDNAINDVHIDLINFYKQIKLGNAKRIYDLMSQYPNEEKTYYIVRDVFKPKDEIEQAFVFFYLRKTCFRGMLRYNKSGKFNIPYGRYKTYNFDILLEPEYTSLLQNTEIHLLGFEEVFNIYNGVDNFIFLDPPYDSTFTDYGYCQFGKEDHIRLAECFKSSKSKCLMIIGETDFINDLYEGYIETKFHKKYAFKIYDGRVGDEIDNYHLVIKNY